MFATHVLVKSIGRKSLSLRYLSTTRYSVYDQRQAMCVAVVGLGAALTLLDGGIAEKNKAHDTTKPRER